MTIDFIRSTVFNLLFYVLTALACVLCLPTLFMKRRYFMGVVQGFVRSVYLLERLVLGLKLEVRGEEHLPANGAYILAAKHQSAYETLKLHLLFKDPAVILKRELLNIPLWGMYLKKSDPIAIDRTDPKGASHSIQEGAKRVAAQGRPIVIFPQGTRVSADQTSAEKPYKVGVARIQEASELPIIPLAMNSGVFWPKHKWIKRSGTVIFSFLPAIEAGQERSALIKNMEEQIEGESLSLMNEAKEDLAMRALNFGSGGMAALLAMAVMLLGFYSFAWFEVAKRTQSEYVEILSNISGETGAYEPPVIKGYPGKMRLSVEREAVQTNRASLSIEDLNIEGWPLPFLPITLESGALSVQYFRWAEPIIFDSLQASLQHEMTQVNILSSTLKHGDFMAHLSGVIDMKAKPAPIIELSVTFEKQQPFLEMLGQSGLIEPHIAMFVSAGLNSFKDDDGLITVPVYQKDFQLFVGPFAVLTFERPLEYDAALGALLHPIQ